MYLGSKHGIQTWQDSRESWRYAEGCGPTQQRQKRRCTSWYVENSPTKSTYKRVLTALKIFIKRPNLHLGLVKQCSRSPTTLGVAWGGVICKGPESNIAITCGGSRDAEVQGLITAHEIAHLFGKYSNEMIVMVMVIELVFLVLQVGVTS